MLRKPRRVKLPMDKESFLALISGSEAGIATTAAIIAGLVIGTDDPDIVTVTAIISIFVQAFNSAMTTALTSHTVDELEQNRDMNSLFRPIAEAGLQFLTHIMTGLLVLLPIVYVTDLYVALLCSVAVALVMLFWIGLLVGRTVQHTPLRNSLQSFAWGVLIIFGGFIAGTLIHG